jgi:tripartite-type tricarboxylate transporter receptor subunit TctC
MNLFICWRIMGCGPLSYDNRMNSFRRSIPFIVVLMLEMFFTAAAGAQSVAEFYRSKTITYNLAVPNGASWGLYAQIFIEHFRKHVPGNPIIILQVMPGGGGVVAANHIYNLAAKDGTVIGTPLSTAMVFAATNPKDVKYDPRGFNWIGSLAGVQDVISVWHTAPAKTLEAARTAELMMGSTGTGSNTFQDIALANNLLGTRFKPVRGYKGGAEIDIAMERGEVQGRATTWDTWTGSHPDWISDRKIIHLLQLGPRKLPDIGDGVPLLRDLVMEGEQKAIVDFIGLSLAMGRSVYAPPGVPKDRIVALRAALVATMQDQSYITAMKNLKLDTTSWQTGDAVERLVSEAFMLPPVLLQRAKAAAELP